MYIFVSLIMIVCMNVFDSTDHKSDKTNNVEERIYHVNIPGTFVQVKYSVIRTYIYIYTCTYFMLCLFCIYKLWITIAMAV